MVKFDCTKEEHRIAREIAARVHAMASNASVRHLHPVSDVVMDIIAVHRNGCPLRLAELLAADDFNFAHDVFGIRRHLDRTTGQLRNCFVPRFARPRAA